MSPNEIYVLEALKDKYGGHFTEGEDPPDAYLEVDTKKIAVEVSRLVEQVKNKDGDFVSRMGHDVPAEKLANDLNVLMQDDIPSEKHILLIIPSPINSIKRTKSKLISTILHHVENNINKSDVEIEGNRITINIYNISRPSGKKIIGAISNRYSSSNITGNTKYLLHDRISTKAEKCTIDTNVDEYWLALYNDYWIADEQSYRAAYKSINIKHNFNKVLIISGDKDVYQL